MKRSVLMLILALWFTKSFAQLTITETSIGVSCFGGSNGTATVVAASGNPPFVYLWSNGDTTDTITNLVANAYTVTVTDQQSVSATAVCTVSSPFQLMLTASALNLNCYGISTGTITTATAGGTVPYTYLWNNNQTTPDLNNLPAGIYTITVTDAHGCPDSLSITISSPTQLLVDSVSGINASCFGAANGSINLGAAGGTPPYTYYGSNGDTSGTGEFTGLIAGTYFITLADANGCTDRDTFSIYQPAQLLLFDSVTNSTNCGGNATIALITTGGNPPYSYMWNTGSDTDVLSNLAANTYLATVADANGCVVVDTVQVLGLAPFTASFMLYPDSLVPHKWYLLYTYSGGLPVSYLWIWGDGDTSSGPYPSHVYADSGYYDICMTLTNSAGCVANYCDSSTFLRSGQQYLISVSAVTQIPTDIEPFATSKLMLYPNPAGNMVHLNTTLAGNIRCQVYNETGELVMEQENNSQSFDMDIHTLSSGMYFVWMIADDKQAIKGFIKQ